MTHPRALSSAAHWLGRLLTVGLLLAGCGRGPSPEEVALAYGRALYANDADGIWKLVSAADRRVKGKGTFRRQQRELRDFVREVMHQLAGFVAATPVRTTINGDRASTVLRFRLPDANALPLKEFLYDWDEDRLNALAESERARIRARLAALHRQRTHPLSRATRRSSWSVRADAGGSSSIGPAARASASMSR